MVLISFSGCVAPTDEKTEQKQKLTRMAKENLSQILKVKADDIKVVGIEEVVWPDPSMGYGDPNVSYVPLAVPGYKIFLQYNETIYEYHAGNGRVVEPIVVPPPDISK